MVAPMGRKTAEDTHGQGGELERDFPGWHVWRGVGTTGWYARRPKSSPPKVTGPHSSLGELRAELEERAAQQRRFDGWDLPPDGT
jgi:hypothetical protein